MTTWEKVGYGRSAEFADVRGVGRFLVDRTQPRARSWTCALNGNAAGCRHSTIDQAREHCDDLAAKALAWRPGDALVWDMPTRKTP
jgi:hypothetical protein